MQQWKRSRSSCPWYASRNLFCRHHRKLSQCCLRGWECSGQPRCSKSSQWEKLFPIPAPSQELVFYCNSPVSRRYRPTSHQVWWYFGQIFSPACGCQLPFADIEGIHREWLTLLLATSFWLWAPCTIGFRLHRSLCIGCWGICVWLGFSRHRGTGIFSWFGSRGARHLGGFMPFSRPSRPTRCRGPTRLVSSSFCFSFFSFSS